MPISRRELIKRFKTNRKILATRYFKRYFGKPEYLKQNLISLEYKNVSGHKRGGLSMTTNEALYPPASAVIFFGDYGAISCNRGLPILAWVKLIA